MVAVIVLLCLLIVATITDVARHTIYNWNTYSGIIAGFVLNACGLGLIGTGWEALQESLFGFLALGFIMLFCFVWFDVGGGDVKLIAMTGAFLGFEHQGQYLGIEAMLWTFVLGAIVGSAILIWQIGFLTIISKTFRHLILMLRAKSWVSLEQEEREPLKRGLFLAPSSLAAVVIVLKDQLF